MTRYHKKDMKKVGLAAAGVCFLILGILGLVLPLLQGILFIAIGLVLLSLASPAVHALVAKYAGKNPKLEAAMRRAERHVLDHPRTVAFALVFLLIAIAGISAGMLFLHRAPAPLEAGIPILLYFYDPELDQGPGGTQCSPKGLVGVARTLPQTETPLREAIALLLRGELSPEERARGITTEFPLPGLALSGATIQDHVATLVFDDPQHRTSGGSCRVAILWRQIEATASQFPGIARVQFSPEYLFQP